MKIQIFKKKIDITKIIPFQCFLMTFVWVMFAFTAYAGTPLKDIKLFAHRGLTTHYPENSFEAIRAAKDLGIYGTEIDLRTTKDGKIILLHDAALDRMTTGKGQVTDTTFSSIQKLSLKDSKSEETSFKVPAFQDILNKVSKWDRFFLALDLKNVDAIKVAKLVLKHNMKDRVYFFIPGPKSVDIAKQIKVLDPNLMISIDLLNWWQIMEVPGFVIKALNADAVFASEWFFPRHGFSEASQANAQVQVSLWGNHDLPKRMERAIKLGAHVISCDRPDILLKHLQTLRQ